MGEILFIKESRKDHFKIDYPYYGLFGSADITPIAGDDGVVYKCKLLNGQEIFLKKPARNWIDANLNRETPLSAVIGTSIDDFLKTYR